MTLDGISVLLSYWMLECASRLPGESHVYSYNSYRRHFSEMGMHSDDECSTYGSAQAGTITKNVSDDSDGSACAQDRSQLTRDFPSYRSLAGSKNGMLMLSSSSFSLPLSRTRIAFSLSSSIGQDEILWPKSDAQDSNGCSPNATLTFFCNRYARIFQQKRR